MMNVVIFDDPNRFRRAAQSFLEQEPITGNVIAVVNQTLGALGPNPQHTWAIIQQDNEIIVGVAMATGPWDLVLSRMSAQAAVILADTLAKGHLDLPGAMGEMQASHAFARRWTHHTGCTAVPGKHLRAFVLDTLIEPEPTRGHGRLFHLDETPLVAKWLETFHAEAMSDDPAVDWTEEATQRISRDEVWTWEVDGAPVSLAACSAPSVGVARIGPVYTPPEHRAKGYAGGATARCAQRALDTGARAVMLYADAANKTSTALYKRLGFTFDHDAQKYRFDK